MKVKLKIKQVNKNTQNSSLNAAAPLTQGGAEGKASFNWGKLLKVLIAIFTAIAGSLGVVSCMA